MTYFKEVIKRGILRADVFSKTSEQSTATTKKYVENMWLLLEDGSSHMVQINGNHCKDKMQQQVSQASAELQLCNRS